jgi:2-keto-4-pentenoate hydratase/2-oxohepta-3-ene-1,7-dioic acid hydratase in catechol pathway
VYRVEGDVWNEPVAGPAVAELDQVELLAPCEPSKIVAIGLNYADHAAESGLEVPEEPLAFLKPSTSVIGPGAKIVYPDHLSQEVHYEAELAVVIGRRAYRVSREQAIDYVAGYTCGNDVTARDLQRRDSQWARAKGIDTFCPLGPWILSPLEVDDLEVCCRVNGQVRQKGRTSQFVFGVDDLISYVSMAMTLLPGDVILTGTPAGVGPLVPGDEVDVEISSIGVLRNRVVAAP